ncbi:jg18477 [Pararge aegeria aegeria]|uniref:Jg18477 protein n=1 Tax=Pararge aegeria aegeria TaxID=348720 RepID=A0A8S4RMS6_9NEOP|nr:jg18477 [Pararge aegeria aegeria]
MGQVIGDGPSFYQAITASLPPRLPPPPPPESKDRAIGKSSGKNTPINTAGGKELVSERTTINRGWFYFRRILCFKNRSGVFCGFKEYKPVILDLPMHKFKEFVKTHLLERGYYTIDEFFNDKVAWKHPAPLSALTR